ncbi:CAP domain-containing protein [Rhodococcus sp. NPDC049939]|uniref:CAP domain-containing protein n=1 Tax=Rhodococcus sp. NPDC049939 TaxID=3155511 RepID=UPI0033C7AEBA
MSLSVVASRRVIATLAVTCSVALSAGTATATAASSPFDLLVSGSAGTGPSDSTDTTVVQEIISATNAERTSRGLRPLIVDSGLTRTAQGWSEVMARTGKFVHNSSSDDDLRPGWTAAAENIIAGWDPESGFDLVARWMRSPGHRANILDRNLTHIGVGFATSSGRDGRYDHYATQNFAAY